MLNLYVSLMSAKLFHSSDLEGLKEGLSETAKEGKSTTRR